MQPQKTIKNEVSIEGIGIHTGQRCKLRLLPAQEDNGIVFHRIDKNVTIRSHIGSIVDTTFATTIGNNGVPIHTVEHLLSAISALGINNINIEVNGPEIPALDGSSIEFIKLLYNAEIVKQTKKMPYIKILQPIFFEDTHSKIAILPYNGRKITLRLLFNNHFLGEQKLSIKINEDSFIKHIAPARTFGFLKDIEYLRANGLAKGGSLDNAVVFNDTSVLNTTGLRFEDECVRHKILDIIGDFSFIGFPIHGHIVADRSGHTTNLNFLKKMLSNIDDWEVITEPVKTTFPVFSFSYA